MAVNLPSGAQYVPIEPQLDEVELRAMLDSAIAEALELADELAALVAAGDGLTPAAARVSANYFQARHLVRQCRNVIAVEAGRR